MIVGIDKANLWRRGMDVILRFRYLDEVRYGNLALSLAFDSNVIYFRVFTGIYSKNLY